jgi:outer membrane protein assembly factor BamB
MKSQSFQAQIVLLAVASLVSISSSLLAADWPMFGRDATRNSVSLEKNAPTEWDIKSGRNIRWKAPLGTGCTGQPVISNGLVWIGTNNFALGDYGSRRDAGVLMCFRERDGKLLYRYVSPRLPNRDEDWPSSVIGASPLVEKDRLWFVTNRCETACLDIGPLRRGTGTPRVVWKVDMRKQFKVVPHTARVFLNRLCSVAGYKKWIYVVTGNAVDGTHQNVPSPKAPSLICFEKESGKIVWADNSLGTYILNGQWASPLVVEVKGMAQVIVPQGDGWVRSFAAEGDGKGHAKLLWKFDMNRKASTWGVTKGNDRNNILATPVFFNGRVYLASGQETERGSGPGRLCCIDPTKTGDISAELAVDANGKILPRRLVQAVDATKGEKAVPNPKSGLVWEFTSVGKKVTDTMHRSLSNVGISDGLVIACDDTGIVHCLDSTSGRRYWSCDTLSEIWGSPLIVDGKAYIGTTEGVCIFLLSKDPNIAMKRVQGQHKPIASPEMETSVYGSPSFANGVLYVASQHWLYAIQKK